VRVANAIFRRLFHAIGMDIRRLKYTEEGILRDLLGVLQPSAVLDVGANVGQYARMLRSAGYAGTIVSFEALESAHAILTKQACDDALWRVAPCAALGRTSGPTQINVAGNSVSSSLLSMSASHVAAAPNSRYVDRKMIQMVSLDSVLPSLLPIPGELFLKIDTQGYEEEILRGANETLASVSAVQLEVSMIQLYEGAPTLSRVFELMGNLGFEAFQMIPGFRDESTGRLLQFDGIFVRPGVIRGPSADS
jgi:FkbM family methyltransferase